MRDLSPLAPSSFDIVQHAYSINFVPDVRAVFAQVARVLRPGGIYTLMFANPFTAGLNPRSWNGAGYPLTMPYVDGAPIQSEDEAWVYRQPPSDDADARPAIPGPREYRHTLSTVVNGLAERGFTIRRLLDSVSISPDPAAEPGTWDHFVALAPPWLTACCTYQPAAPDPSRPG